MNAETLLPLGMFVTLMMFIASGFPVAFTLAGTALIFAVLGYWCDIFLLSDFGFLPAKVFGVMTNFTLLAVPLFIFMGVTLERSGVAEELLETMERLLRNVKGGLTISLIFVGALLAASTGIVGATVVTMGVLSMPTMISRGYNKELSCGTIAASGTLGQIIPPSIVLILLGDMMNVAVADLFAGALFPGLLLVCLYIIYVFVRVAHNPDLAPPFEVPDDAVLDSISSAIVRSVIPPALLILLVLGSILLGVASPTESAACGAVGALLIALCKKKLSIETLRQTTNVTTSMTTMVFTLLIGAQVFSVVFRGLYGDDLISDFITGLDVAPHWILLITMVLLFFLGFFLDFIEICFIVIPVVSPLLTGDLAINPLWLAVLIAINLQTSFLTPPFGFALFYLKGVAPPEIKTAHIYRGIIPFVIIQLLALLVVAFMPQMVLWLPAKIFG